MAEVVLVNAGDIVVVDFVEIALFDDVVLGVCTVEDGDGVVPLTVTGIVVGTDDGVVRGNVAVVVDDGDGANDDDVMFTGEIVVGLVDEIEDSVVSVELLALVPLVSTLVVDEVKAYVDAFREDSVVEDADGKVGSAVVEVVWVGVGAMQSILISMSATSVRIKLYKCTLIMAIRS